MDAHYRGSAIEEGAFGRRVARVCAEKRFFMTDKGSLGLAPTGVREGDVLTFFLGGYSRWCRGRVAVGTKRAVVVLVGDI